MCVRARVCGCSKYRDEFIYEVSTGHDLMPRDAIRALRSKLYFAISVWHSLGRTCRPGVSHAACLATGVFLDVVAAACLRADNEKLEHGLGG